MIQDNRNRGAHRAAIVSALDALEAGDTREAVAVLLNALESGPVVHRCRCRVCGQGFEWPGLRSHHELLAHGYDDDDDERAA